MTRRFWKRVFLLFLLLIAVGIFKIGVLVAFHLWPRVVEPPLWDEHDLVTDQREGENGWDLIRKKRGDLPDWENDDALISYFEKILDAPRFVDTDPISIASTRGHIPLLSDMHKKALNQFLKPSDQAEGHWVYAIWLGIFTKDLSWMESARSLLSHLGALKALNEDLEAFGNLHHTAGQNEVALWSEMTHEIGRHDFTRISLKRALIYEYLQSIDSLQAIERDTRRVSLLFYNRELTKRDLNRYFRRYAELLDDPRAIPDDIDEIIRKDFPALTRGPFWWLVNPVGRLLERIILPFHLGEQIKEFYEDREQLLTQIESLKKI